jgi:hypothetical protein
MAINARDFRWHCGKPYGGYYRPNRKGVADLDWVTLHELGECLGLGPVDLNPENIVGEWGIGDWPIMWPTLYAGVLNPPKLHDDDAAGIKLLYPGS